MFEHLTHIITVFAFTLPIVNLPPGTVPQKLLTLVPGESTRTETIEVLGTPNQTIQEDREILIYQSEQLSRSHLVYVENNLVTFVQIIIPETYNIHLINIINNNGVPDQKLFTTHDITSAAYTYPSKGFTFHVDTADERVFKIQLYPATTVEEYKQTLGKNFLSTPYGDTFEDIDKIKEKIRSQPGNQIAEKNNSLNYSIRTLIAFTLIATALVLSKRKLYRLLVKLKKVRVRD